MALVAGCQTEKRSDSSSAAASTQPPPHVQPTGLCAEIAAASEMQPSSVIALQAPPPGKAIVLSKTGVVARFNRDEFLKAARCLDLKRAVEYIEQETGATAESPLRDAFQLSYVAAALLDVGHVQVQPKAAAQPVKTITRQVWAATGCAGGCRSLGRVYRLTESDPAFFFRVTDRTEKLRH